MRADVIQMVERLLASLDLKAKVRLLTGASFWTTNADERIGPWSSGGPPRQPSTARPPPTANGPA